MIDQPEITPSSDADWKQYYEKKSIETDKQLKYLSWAFAHMLRFAMTGKKEEAYTMARRAVNRLQYPIDRDQIIDEMAKWREFSGSILRKEI